MRDRRQFLKFLAASPICNALSGFGAAHADDGTGQQVSSPADAIDIFDLEATASETLPLAHYAYLATGVNDDRTLRANREVFDRFYLRSRRLVDVSNVDTTVNILGQRWHSPIVLAPAGSQKAFHADGELATAHAARRRDHLQILSTVTSTPLEEVIEARNAPVWFQLYPTGRWDVTEKLLRRAEVAGCPAVVLTVDIPHAPEARHTLQRLSRADSRDCATCHRGGGIASGPEVMYAEFGLQPGDRSQAMLTWDFLDRLREATSMKLLVKGIVTAEDARRCLEKSVDGIIVSNHGGRADDSGRGALDSLAEVAAEVRGRTTLLMDSGIRRGTDIMKALALGADAVCIGRPYLWGLASFGQAGVERALELLQNELRIAMQFAGTATLDAIGSDTIGRHAA